MNENIRRSAGCCLFGGAGGSRLRLRLRLRGRLGCQAVYQDAEDAHALQQQRFSLPNIRFVLHATGYEHIKAGGAFYSRAVRDLPVAAAVLGGSLGVSFGNVEGDAGAGAIELIPRGHSAWKRVNKGADPSAKLDGLLVNDKLFVGKGHWVGGWSLRQKAEMDQDKDEDQDQE